MRNPAENSKVWCSGSTECRPSCLSTPHRATNVSGRARYAIPYFFDAHPDTVISCLPSCQPPGNPPKYEPITYHDYAAWYADRNYVHLSQSHEAA